MSGRSSSSSSSSSSSLCEQQQQCVASADVPARCGGLRARLGVRGRRRWSLVCGGFARRSF